jgi:hypothetical protein
MLQNGDYIFEALVAFATNAHFAERTAENMNIPHREFFQIMLMA